MKPIGYFYPRELERSLKDYPEGFPGAVAVYAAPNPDQTTTLAEVLAAVHVKENEQAGEIARLNKQLRNISHQAVADEYNRWILAHAAGQSYDEFLAHEFKTRQEGHQVRAPLVFTGSLITVNQDEYPGLGPVHMQIRLRENPDVVVARVYGENPFHVSYRARLVEQAINAKGEI